MGHYLEMQNPPNDCWGCSLKNETEIHPWGWKKLAIKPHFALTGHRVMTGGRIFLLSTKDGRLDHRKK